MSIFYLGKTFETMDDYLAFRKAHDAAYEAVLAGHVPQQLEPMNEVVADAPPDSAVQTQETQPATPKPKRGKKVSDAASAPDEGTDH